MSDQILLLKINKSKETSLKVVFTDFENLPIPKCLKDIDELKNSLSSLIIQEISIEGEEHLLVHQDIQSVLRTKIGELAHEVNNSLTIISASSKILTKKLPLIEGVNPLLLQLCDDMNGAVTNTKNTLNSLLQGSHFSTMKKTKTTAFNIWNKCNDDLKNFVSENGVEIEENLDESSQNLVVTELGETLSQSILNIVKNSCYAMKNSKSPKLTVDIKKLEDKYITLQFTDNGEGVSSDIQNQIFEQDFTTKGLEGSGFGLYLTKIYIEMNGGEISLDKDYKDGARFILRLPEYEKNE